MFDLIEINTNNLAHIKDLYTLLKNKVHNISHENMPTFDDHFSFVKSSPYRKWYLIKKNSKTCGSFYLTHNNVIGINLLSNNCDEYIELINLIILDHKPLPPIESLRSKYFSINAKPTNSNLIKALKSLNMDHIQSTYALKNIY